MRLKDFGWAIAGLLAAIAMWATPASAQQFCSGPLTPTDGAICESPTLSALNNEIADLYVQAINRAYADGGPADAIKHQHSAWMRGLRDCGGDVGCIEDSMASHRSVLQAMLPTSPITDPPAAIDEAVETTSPEEAVETPPQASIVVDVPPTLEAEVPSGVLDGVRGWLKWLLYLTALGVIFFGISIVYRTLKVAKLQYGHDLVFNKGGFASFGAAVLLLLGLLTGAGALILWPIALLCLLVALSYNVRRTTFGIGLIGTIVQPFVLIITVAGLYWLANASRRIATGDRQGL